MVTPIAFLVFKTRALDLYSTGKHSPGTLIKVKQVLQELQQLGPETTADLTTGLMARYVASKGSTANPNTVNGLLSYAATLCTFAEGEGWLERLPQWRRLRLRPRAMTRNSPQGFEALCGLLGHLSQRRHTWEDHRLFALTHTFALTALRLNEALHAQLVDLDLGEKPSLAVVPRRRLKTEASARVVPLPAELAEVLRGWVPHAGPTWLFPGSKRRGPWTGGGPGYRPLHVLQAAALEVGISRITWHSLRHAYGTNALERWGLPVWIVQRVMGHTDPRTTEKYLHLDHSPAIGAAVRGIGYLARG